MEVKNVELQGNTLVLIHFECGGDSHNRKLSEAESRRRFVHHRAVAAVVRPARTRLSHLKCWDSNVSRGSLCRALQRRAPPEKELCCRPFSLDRALLRASVFVRRRAL